MPTTETHNVSDLSLDLINYRMVPQPNERSAIRTMISINPDWFWALADSILGDGYHPTENILVLKNGKKDHPLIVKEGNRRIAILKLIFGQVRRNGLPIPTSIEEKIAALTEDWKIANRAIPCAVYESTEAAAVDKMVALTHGKGEKAGRDKWKPVARGGVGPVRWFTRSFCAA